MPNRSEFWNFLLGRLSLDSLPLHNMIVVVTFIVVATGGAALLGFITWKRQWGYLWTEWFTSVDHKKLGIMYMILATVMLFRGFADAIMMRAQQAIAFGDNMGYLPPHHYDQIFTAHGAIMIFFVAMAYIVGLMNYVMPMQIGARDVAFPFLNNFSFWLTVSGVLLFMVSLFIGDFSHAGWLGYPPVSELHQSPGPGVDYYIWGLQLSGLGTLLTGINFVVTILKMRAPGMTLMKMPMFTWTTLCTSGLIVVTFPILTATLLLLSLDRYIGTHFFTAGMGGNVMMYINLIWIWGHPEVYILILPLFGVFSEIVSTFSGKRLFGYSSMVYATVSIMILSYLVWLHHFFTMGSGADVNSFFSLTTMMISIPTGAKIFNWLFTMYRGRVRFDVPMLWTMGFLFTFTIGGMTGVMLSVAPADFLLHNSLFLIAHFHNVIIGGVVFGIFAGINYWFPKAFGFRLDPFWGKCSFWFWQIGFWFAFGPLYILGLMGVTRRLSHFTDPSLQKWFIIAAFGAFLILLGILSFVMQIYVSIRNREKYAVGHDPWGGRTLEWQTSSPPPPYNFAFVPKVHERDAWTNMKESGYQRPLQGFNDIHMPKSTATGVVLSALGFVFGFAMVWYIWWLAAVSFVALIAYAIFHTFNYNRDYHVSADEVNRFEHSGNWASDPQEARA
ncbi:cytochrome o ubiquinol oxidase subunit I [Oleiagrimonas sp. MCCC 1A03011]|uniref:cytochrome o ubiquinol oxidase subunit I n=1 Tax=Oleiagrimonas sp. MCCC 1A03011 TaxID=1926883 RepID=UPI000DC232ED|nr:cytochrome o ubiquinol oxidase subunit I [Oleiagrimonas sp. MCCC 1A03011]RAP58423.1 cytochrome o ubiquinol oxidase subunit I [Oleiagrimonas sp. MCCC 1A03011]